MSKEAMLTAEVTVLTEMVRVLSDKLAIEQNKQEQGEPDKYVMDIECTKCGAKQSGVLTVNTTPQQRTWVGLTDEQIKEASLKAGMQEHYMDFHSGFVRFARAIEAAHGIKE